MPSLAKAMNAAAIRPEAPIDKLVTSSLPKIIHRPPNLQINEVNL